MVGETHGLRIIIVLLVDISPISKKLKADFSY